MCLTILCAPVVYPNWSVISIVVYQASSYIRRLSQPFELLFNCCVSIDMLANSLWDFALAQDLLLCSWELGIFGNGIGL